MSRPPSLVVAIVGATVVWLLLPALAWPARTMAAFLIGILPVLAVAQLRLIDDPSQLPRMSAYLSTGVTLWLLAGITALAAVSSGYDARAVGIVALPLVQTVAWTAGITACAVLVGIAMQRAGLRESAILMHLLPETRNDRIAFAALSVTAGVCEELIFRGFLITALADTTGSVALAVVISTAVFGWAHAYQRWAGAARAATLGAVLTLPVVFAGSVIPSMLAHTAIDLIGGLLLRDRYVS